MPERIDFWGIPQPWGPILVYTLVTLAFVIMLARLYMRASLWWKVGRAERLWDQPLKRIGRLFTYAVVQVRVLSQRYAGVMHAALAWSFFVFFLGTALATINGHFFKFLVGSPYLIYKLVLDLFTAFFIVGVVLAFYRRFVQRPQRLTFKPGFSFSLIFITFIVLNGLIIESLRLAIERPAWAIWSPVGWALAQIWIATGASDAALQGFHLGYFTLHFTTVAAFFVTLPVGTLLHVVTGPIDVFFSRLDRPVGKLVPIPQTPEGDYLYADRLERLSWKQLLDGDACTECGRCQEECPAFSSGNPLSPKQLIVDLRETLHSNGIAVKGKLPEAHLVSDRISDDELWACTTCGACDQECPVLINHVDTIVDMRRYLVSEGKVDAHLQDALASLSRYGNSFNQSERARTKWSLSVQPKIKDARREPVEFLWFVGDYASYNPMLSEVTRKTAEIFQKAGLDFGILYEGERNSGNDARRAGEEGLFEYLVEKNTALLSKAYFKSIVTTDPLTYNTLKNEYPVEAFAGRPVIHYTELLEQLIHSGGLKLTKRIGARVTYHDPCYLGRFNGIYEAPRRVIAATGCELVEMSRNRGRALCCGAGGGRIWMDEGDFGERSSETRVREAAAMDGISALVVTCPKDMVMFSDAVNTTGLEKNLRIKDLVDLVYEAI